nr:sensor histidine kinase [uncultured Acetatifactor sp.]
MKANPFKTIKASLMICFSALILLALIIFYQISLQYTEKAVLENSIDYSVKLVNQVNSDIDFYINYMLNISAMMIRDDDIQDYLAGGVDLEETEDRDRILTQFRTIIETRDDIANIAVISKEGKAVINQGSDRINPNVDLEKVEWFQDALNAQGYLLSSSHVQYVIDNNYKWVVTLSHPVYLEGREEPDGVFFIDLNYRLLRDLCDNNSLGLNSYVFIVDGQGRIIYHPKQQLLLRNLTTEKIDEVMQWGEGYFIAGEGNERQLYTISKSEQTGWSVVGVVSFSSLMPLQNETQLMYLLLAGGLILFGILFAMLLTGAITKPIRELCDAMRQVERGNFEKASIQNIPGNEIGVLGNSFNIMISRIHQLMDENIREQQQKRKSELKALRNQINPHFLYNTLDSIIWMAEGGKNKEVVMMTSSLAKLLRQSISNEDEMIPLWKEIEYTKSYLTIQKMRYKDKLEFSMEISPEIMEERIVNLILQPIVENAIYHGIKNKAGKGMIRITGRLLEDDILLEVADNGVGMKEDVVRHIFDMSREHEKKKNGGVGIYNVHLRIRLYYGEKYGLTFFSQEGEGTVVKIRLARYAQEKPEGRRWEYETSGTK